MTRPARTARLAAVARAVALAGLLAPSLARAAAAPRGGPAAARTDVYAVIVGYNGAPEGTGLPTLHFADDDAVRFSLLLSGFAPAADVGRVVLLTRIDEETRRGLAAAGLTARPNGPPTRSALQAAIAAVGRALAARPPGAPPPTFYFVYAGHGLSGRILLEPEAGEATGLTGHELQAAVAQLGRAAPGLRSYLFLDACRSQSLFTERGGDGAALGPDLSAEIEALERRTTAAASSIGVLTAAFAGQSTGEVRALGAGYFSHVLASGLAGAADADGDEQVTFAELAAFVAYNTERLGAQRPWFSPPGGELAAPVVDLRGARARLELSAAPAGRYLVEAAGGRPILAEAIKGERPLRLALPPGRYRVVHATSRERTRAADVELVGGAPLDLAATTAWTDVAAAAPTLARGDITDGAATADALDPTAPAFASPFTPEAVSTLRAAYDAGREPPSAARGYAQTVGVAAVLGSAPLDLDGVETGVALRYRRAFGRLLAGADVSFGWSSHVAGTSYRLDRTLALLSLGPRFLPFNRLELSLAALVGGGPLLRHAAGTTSGDPFAPLVGAGGGLALRIEGRWTATLDARAVAQWVGVDGAARRTTGASLQAGLGWVF
jgi:hypothetical protein